jgi:hypothetical protein
MSNNLSQWLKMSLSRLLIKQQPHGNNNKREATGFEASGHLIYRREMRDEGESVLDLQKKGDDS